MTIKFICTCGKHLRARDEMAARRSVCPRCGSPVGIPSLKPTHRGGMARPMTPQERLRRARPPVPGETAAPQSSPAAPATAPPIDTRLVRLLSSRGARSPALTGRHLEERWQECLWYPLRAWRLGFALALLLTILVASMAVLLPHLVAAVPAGGGAPPLVPLVGGVLLVVLLVGLPCSFLECVLSSAVAGEVYYILWSGWPLLVLLHAGAKWLTCLLAGPVVFAAAGWWYWMNCGDPVLVDYLILTELGVVAIAYWTFVLLAVTDRGRLRDLNPVAVADLAHRLGWRALVVVLAAALLFLAHGFFLIASVAAVHTAVLRGLLMLAGGWFSGTFWSVFFCRLLGVWCHRSRLQLVVQAGPVAAEARDRGGLFPGKA